ncbi:O-antigen ligase family protein [Vibrio fortis]|uniref:O-antigen ligase family protein n=1 Tax=Vibrio fortis TaxID=212667 RepID=UPI0038CD38CD
MIYLIGGCLIVDVLHGYLVQSLRVDLMISTLYKLVLIVFSLFYLAIVDRTKFVFLIFLFCFLLISPIRLLILGIDDVHIYDLTLLMKYLFLISIFLFSLDASKRYLNIYSERVGVILSLNYYIVIISVLMGYVGIGFYTYNSTEMGFKGFFIAGNELSALFILLSIYKLYRVWNSCVKFKTVRYVFCTLVIVIVGSSIGTKAALISAITTPIIIPLASVAKTKRDLTLLVGLGLFIITLLSMFIVPMFFSGKFSSDLIDRAIYYYESKGFLGMLLSGREELLFSYYSSLSSSSDVFSVIFGTGHIGLKEVYEKNFIEIDPFDAAMYFGLPFALLLTLTSLWIITKSYLYFGVSKFASLVLVANVFMFFFAIIAGHVWTSSLLTISWCILTNLLWNKNEDS